ncbi:DUF2156 domain-containing protein [Clostridium fermenticellae]|uniref:DUF2156 domain-containing protein n=1 Tax=Clostridium fermenticellae TaxID=2068654 RepID=A0A386H334_9CLOT|nr:phosphatidylglycerol lysyltransferase domain-containing protein [Clostridium fermenticellae]AYD39953.1 DUF2156 domain-containing protein [Clostridium fermenticellae]
MMDFKKLELEDKELFDKYIYPYKFLSCEYSFTTLYIWRDACDIRYTIYKNALIIKKKDFNGDYYFMQPLGYDKDDLKDIVEKLSNYKMEFHMEYLFKDLEENFIVEIKSLFGNIDGCIKEDRDNFDYLYEAKKLIMLSGKKLHKKKNHYNSFVKNYNYEVVSINSKNVADDVIESARTWYDENKSGQEDMLYYELQGIEDIVDNIEKLSLVGIAVYIDGKIAAFTIGERLNSKLAVIHIEKADRNVNGAYSFINKEFVDRCFNDAEIINREQDLGIVGLRKSKMSYYPIKLEKKFILNC